MIVILMHPAEPPCMKVQGFTMEIGNIKPDYTAGKAVQIRLDVSGIYVSVQLQVRGLPLFSCPRIRCG